MEKKTKLLDNEWVQLLREARKVGLTVDEVRHFLKSSEKSSESPPMVRSHSIKPF
ncbi:MULTISPECIES: anti-repressor SinI family protein [Bacillus]|uniref:Anti-repressor SinI family protein n=1 Tax=Bacillus xiamenensis TaxID=1178537 RepID=A0ABT4F7M4_9BACI|nr:MULTISPECIES: anti-repressor SinI family protein [Bacillus]EKF34602.1 SinR antagonist [Bacillus xiamenensis]MCW1837480.1 anti-repressor SinI family protein [Bacillus xiamenensis]MCY9576653.1 anti-repressor SinI family protein [Bacillus xiamenensis]QGX65476.1 DNA-binding anti-repressor SinI [Bacillus sp. ms-22]